MAKKRETRTEEVNEAAAASRSGATGATPTDMWTLQPNFPWIEPWLSLWANAPWPFNIWSLPQGEKSGMMDAWPVGFWAAGASPQSQSPANLMETWLSYSPAAPFFGMRWALSDLAAASTSCGGASTPKGPLSAQAARERSALNHIQIASPAPAGAEDAAPAPARRKPRLRVVGSPDAEPAVKEETPAKAEAAPAPSAKTAKAAKPAKAAPVKPAAKPVVPDDLKKIKGVGPKLEKLLNELGVQSFDQIVKMKVADFEALDEKLGAFRGRWKRDDWVGQAKTLKKS
ncbi:MAG: hypothetical protein MRY74_06730 [Neomegalonema sp.]|nr:hypothetical protein [Neomegalonema sp.]